jgi:hypothetical protein
MNIIMTDELLLFIQKISSKASFVIYDSLFLSQTNLSIHVGFWIKDWRFEIFIFYIIYPHSRRITNESMRTLAHCPLFSPLRIVNSIYLLFIY